MVNVALAIQLPRTARRDALFYCVELFDGSGLTAIQFFDGAQLELAKRSSVEAVRGRSASRARVIDDRGRLVFRPALPAPCPAVVR